MDTAFQSEDAVTITGLVKRLFSVGDALCNSVRFSSNPLAELFTCVTSIRKALPTFQSGFRSDMLPLLLGIYRRPKYLLSATVYVVDKM
ncbi:hypothetical protein C9993_11710 [Marinobacter sp. Z-F4-2]|nr:hypothetical protein C9993_11710 [Marinobacter sp. Z-F4-2]